MQKFSTRHMTRIAMLAVLAGILHLRPFRFPLPFMPPIFDYDLSSIPEMIGAFSMGPGAGVIIVLLKNLIKALLEGPSPAITGEIQNVILSSVYLITATSIYRWGRSVRKSALIGMITASFVTAGVAIFTNMYFIIPFYSMAMGFTVDSIVAMTRAVNPYVTSPMMFILLGIIPFNLIKGGLTALFNYFLYPTLMKIAWVGDKYTIR